MEKLNNYESEYIKEELKWAINGRAIRRLTGESHEVKQHRIIIER